MEQQKALRAVMICLLLIAMAVVGRETAVYVETVNAVSVLKEERHTPGEESPVVVIDAGHGGDDPGKIGINGSLEKDINLNIVNKLAGYLEAEGVQVVLTRDTEEGLYDAHASNKKGTGYEAQDREDRGDGSGPYSKCSPEQLPGGVCPWSPGILL